MENNTKNAIIAGVFTVIGSLVSGLCTEMIVSNKYEKQNNEIEKNVIDSGIEIDETESIITIIDRLIDQYDEAKDELADLKPENERLNKENEELSIINEELSIENEKLKNDIEELKKKINPPGPDPDSDPDTNPHTDKVSLLSMKTMKGTPNWKTSSDSEEDFSDNYNNQYPSASIGVHYASEAIDNTRTLPTYLLDQQYTTCKGQIVLSGRERSDRAKAWVEFYSGSKLVYKTEKITVTDKVLDFEFDVSELDTLTIVKRCESGSVYVIYPLLDLIK